MSILLATTSSFGTACPEVVQIVKDAGYALETNPYGRKLTEGELLELLQKHQPVGLLAGTEPVTANVLKQASAYLKAVARVGVGWDNVAHETAAELHIPVSRTEGILDQPVAELALGMMLNALRHVSRHDRNIRAGVWKKEMGNLLAAQTVGVVGCGAIGRKVAELCRAFGARVICSDVCTVNNSDVEQLKLNELMAEADIITVHASGSECLIGADQLALCKPKAIFVNTARGGMIDEAALAQALADGKAGYACMDVFENEPYSGPLAGLDNTILTAHIGSYSAESRIAMEMKAVENILKDLA
ncbi:MAG: hydroxyacid dehydrogenase [Pseudodesulfovibrio sp.]|nr:hydroxyacid dehydrogenase [Pseudodesulfovibrio sp.]